MVIAPCCHRTRQGHPSYLGQWQVPTLPPDKGPRKLSLCSGSSQTSTYTVQIQQWKTRVSFLYRFRKLFRLGCAEIMIWCGRRRDWEISGVGRLASWQFLVRSFPNAGAEKWERGAGGGTIQKERKSAEMEKGLKMGISCACLWQKGNKHAQINNGLIWKAFILWDARLIFFPLFFFLNTAWPTLSLRRSEEATQILHEDLTLIVADSDVLGMRGLLVRNRNYR